MKMLAAAVIAFLSSAAMAEALPHSEANPPIYRLQLAQSWDCGSRKTCGRIGSCDEAKYYLFNCTWGGKLDGDDDGAPCEQLCGSNN